ncbi:hypothetical protein AAC387_Pa06g1998 [Persea americana]
MECNSHSSSFKCNRIPYRVTKEERLKKLKAEHGKVQLISIFVVIWWRHEFSKKPLLRVTTGYSMEGSFWMKGIFTS